MTIHRANRSIAAAAAVALFAGVAQGGPMDENYTQNGSFAPSGTWREALVNSVDELLLAFNNDITYDITASLDPVEVLDYVPMQDHYMVGEIMFADDENTRLIYDRLAVRAVVHVIGYHPGELPLDDVSPVMLLTNEKQLISATGAFNLPASSGGGAVGQPAPEPLTPTSPRHVPEPGSVLLIGLAAAWLMSRRTNATKLN